MAAVGQQTRQPLAALHVALLDDFVQLRFQMRDPGR